MLRVQSTYFEWFQYGLLRFPKKAKYVLECPSNLLTVSLCQVFNYPFLSYKIYCRRPSNFYNRQLLFQVLQMRGNHPHALIAVWLTSWVDYDSTTQLDTPSILVYIYCLPFPIFHKHRSGQIWSDTIHTVILMHRNRKDLRGPGTFE